MVQATAPPYHTPLERDDPSDPQALRAAEQHTDSYCLQDVHIDKLDGSPALRRLTERLQKRV